MTVLTPVPLISRTSILQLKSFSTWSRLSSISGVEDRYQTAVQQEGDSLSANATER